MSTVAQRRHDRHDRSAKRSPSPRDRRQPSATASRDRRRSVSRKRSVTPKRKRSPTPDRHQRHRRSPTPPQHRGNRKRTPSPRSHRRRSNTPPPQAVLARQRSSRRDSPSPPPTHSRSDRDKASAVASKREQRRDRSRSEKRRSVSPRRQASISRRRSNSRRRIAVSQARRSVSSSSSSSSGSSRSRSSARNTKHKLSVSPPRRSHRQSPAPTKQQTARPTSRGRRSHSKQSSRKRSASRGSSSRRSPSVPRRNFSNPFARRPVQGIPELPPTSGTKHTAAVATTMARTASRFDLRVPIVRPHAVVAESTLARSSSSNSRVAEFLKSPPSKRRVSQTPPPTRSRSRSPPRKRSRTPKKIADSSRKPRSSRSSSSSDDDGKSDSSALSYSPVRRHPERYSDVIGPNAKKKQQEIASIRSTRAPSKAADSGKHSKRSRSPSRETKVPRKPQPVVHLHPTTESEESDAEQAGHGSENSQFKSSNQLSEMVDRDGPADADIQKDPGMMKALSGIAAKAKEKIKTMSDPTAVAAASSSLGVSAGRTGESPEDALAISREMAIASFTKAAKLQAAGDRSRTPVVSAPVQKQCTVQKRNSRSRSPKATTSAAAASSKKRRSTDRSADSKKIADKKKSRSRSRS